MNAHGTATASRLQEACPYCGQPITRAQLEAIRERIRREEQVRLKTVEKQVKEDAIKSVRRQAEQLTKRSAELAKRERVLEQRAKALETAAKARYDDGYRKAQSEAARTRLQLQKQVDDLKRRIERKTADDLGAIPEEELVERLQRRYPGDEIQRIPRGEGGADVLQTVRDGGRVCGRIVYESKNVKNFLSAYVDKARGYRTRYGTPYVIIATTAFPAGERDFCARDGVLLVHPSKVEYLADLIRASLVELSRAAAAGTERESKAAKLLAYVTSDEFKERVRALLDVVEDLRDLQAEERKRHEYVWGSQEEAFRALEGCAGRIQGKVRAIVEGRG
jgi:hypothetical protein